MLLNLVVETRGTSWIPKTQTQILVREFPQCKSAKLSPFDAVHLDKQDKSRGRFGTVPETPIAIGVRQTTGKWLYIDQTEGIVTSGTLF